MNYQKSKLLTTTTWKKFEHLLEEVSKIKLAMLSSSRETIDNKKVEGLKIKVESIERLLTSPKLSVYRLFRHCLAIGLINTSELSSQDTSALITQLNKLLDLYNLQEISATDILSECFPTDPQHQYILSSLDNIDLSCIQKLASNLN
jgi:hypothetical protein